MIYKAYLKQKGVGCDYTIGCGQIVIDIKASNLDEAQREIYQLIKDNFRGDCELKSFEIYEINKVFESGNLNDWYLSQKVRNGSKHEDPEYKEYQRLKAKFEK
jgi:hypothetical protein